MITFIKETSIDFVGKRKSFYILSGILAMLGLIALIQIARGGGHLGIEFAGGAVVQLKFEHPIEIDAARRALESGGIKDAELQEVVAEHKLIIRLKRKNIAEKNTRSEIRDAFISAFPDNTFEVESSTEIGPTIGKKLQGDALNAILFSLVMIIAYIAFRFEFRFGLAAAIATFHDVFVVLGIFYVMNKEITLLVVTALLTIAGYSINDTVVIFDRIRENLKSRKKESFEALINRSINDNLSRTFITGVTTFLAVVALYFFGGEVIHDFSSAMILGIVVGTYSSWFIASSLLVSWHKGATETNKGKTTKVLKGAKRSA